MAQNMHDKLLFTLRAITVVQPNVVNNDSTNWLIVL